MNDRQRNRFNSLLKSNDFLTDHQPEFITVPEVEQGQINLLAIINKISNEAGLGDQDHSGVTLGKQQKRDTLTSITLKVARGAAARFKLNGDPENEQYCTVTEAELIALDGVKFHYKCQRIMQIAQPIAATLVNAAAADVTALATACDVFFLAIDDTKRAVEISAKHNAQIDPLIAKAMKLRMDIDVLLQTFIATAPDLYAEWELSLGIDDTGADAPVALAVDMTVATSAYATVGYSGVALAGNTEIKLINASAGALKIGFGSNATSFTASQTVPAGASKRYTAATLGFNALSALSLNIQNEAAVPLSCVVEFYVME